MIYINFHTSRFGNVLFMLFNGISYCLEHGLRLGINSIDKFENKRHKKIMKNFLSKDPKLKEYKEISHRYQKLPVMDDVCLSGYFQSEKYFKKNVDQILDILEVEKFKQTNIQFNNYVSLHIRAGDALDKSILIYRLTTEYYINAINKLILDTKKDNWKILISVEPGKKNEAYATSQKTILEKVFPKIKFFVLFGTDTWDHLIKMSNCKHLILSNSTYSWWSGYFAKYYDSKKNIYRPTDVFKFSWRNSLPINDFYPDYFCPVNTVIE